MDRIKDDSTTSLAKPNEVIEEVTIELFFERSTEIRDWFGEREKARAEKFAGLQKLLAENLRGLRVYRIGRVQVEILAVGLAADGCVMGIATQAVKTQALPAIFASVSANGKNTGFTTEAREKKYRVCRGSPNCGPCE